jgi:4-amino-4-deoxy-L-arabinose transferase-like glycosyltransferase
MLAGMFYVAGRDAPVFYARLMNAALGTLVVAAVYWLARRLFDSQTALLATGAAAVYPGAVASSVFVLSEAPFCPLLVAQLATQVAAWQAQRRVTSFGWSLAAGALAGAATLMRLSWLLFVPFAMVCGIALSRSRLKHLACGLVMLVDSWP